MIRFQKEFLCCFYGLYRFQLRDELPDQSNDLCGIEFRKEPLDHISDRDGAQRRTNVRDNVQVRTARWTKGVNLTKERTSEDIEKRHNQFVTSGVVSLGLTKPNKLEVVRSGNH
jgi:hypothetical protein